MSSKQKHATAINSPTHEEVERLLVALREAGFKEAGLIRRLGFRVSSCGMLIGFDRANEIAATLAAHKSENSTQAYAFPDKWYIATPEAAADVKIYIPDEDPTWSALIQNSLNEWNNVGPGVCVHLRTVDTPAEADTVVHLINDPTPYLGFAEMPNNGRVGTDLYINIHHSHAYGDSVYKNTIVHEMGHALGMAHSGGVDPSFSIPDQHIPGTAEHEDPRAVMASLGHEWFGWSTDEKMAMAYLFPRDQLDDLTTFDGRD